MGVAFFGFCFMKHKQCDQYDEKNNWELRLEI